MFSKSRFSRIVAATVVFVVLGAIGTVFFLFSSHFSDVFEKTFNATKINATEEAKIANESLNRSERPETARRSQLSRPSADARPDRGRDRRRRPDVPPISRFYERRSDKNRSARSRNARIDRFFAGRRVEKGDVLFRFESFDYRNDVDSARADLVAATAREARAKATHERNLRLRNDESVRGVVPEETLETSRADWQEAIAATSKARSRLEMAQKQLKRTVVRAPTRGQISKSLFPVGSFVDGTSLEPPTLATLVAMNPMRVYFYATDREFLEFQRQKRNELKAALGENYDAEKYDENPLIEILNKERLSNFVEFEVGFPGLDAEGIYSRRGVVNYVDNKFDLSTGLVALRGEIPNADYSIYPGVVCNVRVPGETLANATLIDVRAVCRDLNAEYIWLVDAENRSRRQPIELGRTTENGRQVVVLKGVKPGDRYVVDGVLNLRSGSKIVEAPPA